VEIEDPEEREGSGCAGAAVVTAAVLALGGVFYAASPAFFVLALWALPLAWFGYLWAAKRYVFDTANPAPPPAPEGATEEEPQVTTLRDKSHPNRWLVLKPSEWLGRTYDDRDES
jgi:hypothetical protein